MNTKKLPQTERRAAILMFAAVILILPHYCLAGQWTIYSNLKYDHIYDIHVDRQEKVWVGHPNFGLSIYSGGEWVYYDEGFLTQTSIFKIFEDNESNFWICTGDSVAVYKDYLLHTAEIAGNAFLADHRIRHLAETPAGIFFAGTPEGILKKENGVWTSEESIEGNYILFLLCDKEGDIWAGLLDRGIANYRNGDWEIWDTTNASFKNNTFVCGAVDTDGNIWASSNSPDCSKAGLFLFDGHTWQEVDTQNKLDCNITCLACDSSGAIWAGTKNSVGRYKNGAWEAYTTENSGMIDDCIQDIAVSPANLVYIASRHYGLMRYDPNYADCSQEKALTLSSPTAGAQIKTGDPASIQWSSTGCIDSVVIAYRKDTQPWQVIDTITNHRSYSWTAPGSPADQYQIRISDLKTPSVSATSDRFAIIQQQQNAAPVITNQPDSIVVQEGEAKSWTATVEDADGDEAVISFESVPAWASVEDFTLTLNPQGDSNSDTVLVIADDGNGGRDTLSLRVIVEHPVITVRPRNGDGEFHFSIPDLQIVFRCSLKKVTTIDVVSVAGRTIKTLAVAGDSAIWDGRDSTGARIKTGVYALRLREKGGRSIVRKIVVAK